MSIGQFMPMSAGVSEAGKVWTPLVAPQNNTWLDVTYGNGTFVAVSFDGTNRVMTSPDGITWTLRNAAQANGWWGVAYGKGLFVAVASNGTNRVMTSPDGITWTARNAASALAWTKVVFDGNQFVAMDNANGSTVTARVMTSPDGITWTARTSNPSRAQSFQAVCAGASGLVIVGGVTTTPVVLRSSDGITWTYRTPAAGTNLLTGVAYGNGIYVAVSRGVGFGFVVTSTDSLTWTRRADIPECEAYDVFFGNGLFVIAGIGGNKPIQTSPDGLNWTGFAVNSPGSTWSKGCGDAGKFVVLARDGTNKILVSG